MSMTSVLIDGWARGTGEATLTYSQLKVQQTDQDS